MKKALLAILILSGPCKSTGSINGYAKSTGSGMTEINKSILSFSNICRLYDQAAMTGNN